MATSCHETTRSGLREQVGNLLVAVPEQLVLIRLGHRLLGIGITCCRTVDRGGRGPDGRLGRTVIRVDGRDRFQCQRAGHSHPRPAEIRAGFRTRRIDSEDDPPPGSRRIGRQEQQAGPGGFSQRRVLELFGVVGRVPLPEPRGHREGELGVDRFGRPPAGSNGTVAGT